MKANLLYKCTDETGEAATWLPEREEFLWTDIDNGVLHRYIPITRQCIEYHLPAMLSAIIPLKGNKEEVLLALQGKIIVFNLMDGNFRCLKEVEIAHPELRPNDGKASPEGRLWLGMMHLTNHRETGSLRCFNADLSMRKVLKKQSIPNGIVWNKIGDKMYYADSGRGCIEEYHYDTSNGSIHFSRTAVQVPARYGIPDGMAIDAQGLLWVAHWGGFGVYVWDPDTGALIHKVEVPAPNVTSCAFGGEDNRRLFITTARSGLSESAREQFPLSGSLFYTDVVVPGENHHSFSLC
jgi:sugar lactone lactonase YvrE